MTTLVTVEIVSAVFLGILFITHTSERDRSGSSRLLNLCILLVLITLLVDAMAYAFMDDSTPFAFRYLVCLYAYLGEGICFLGFAYYSEAIFAERTDVDPGVFRILKIAEVVWIAATAAAFISGKMVVFENGVEVRDNGYPVYLAVYQIIIMLFTPAVALRHRKKLGTDAVILLSFFNITPIAGILSAIFAYYDISYVLGAVALVLISEILQRRQIRESENLKTAAVQLRHEQLRAEVLSFMVDHDDDPIELLKNFAERLRVLFGCDQVIYRDLEETRIMVNSPEIEKTWSVPIEYCRQCQHFDAHHPMYALGYTEMDNCQEGWQGIPVYHDCPIKSSLTRIVYCDGEIAGYLAIHYVQKYHHFTDLERSTLEEFTRILSMSLSRYQATIRAGELDSVKRTLNMMFLLSDAFDPIIVLDPESGNYDWYQSHTQEAAETIHGEDLYQSIGVDGSTIIHEEDREQSRAFFSRENMMRIAETGEAQEFENRWQVDQDRILWKTNKAVRMVDENGRVCIVIGVIDTTEKKEKEAQLQEAYQELEAANRSKTDFLFSMSHDIRTPMNAITGFTNMAVKYIDDREKVLDCLDKTQRSSAMLLSLINSVLEVSRIESGHAGIDAQPADIFDSFVNIENTMQEMAGEKHIALSFGFGNIRDRYIYADRSRCMRVFVNVISNAVKYTHEGGTVKVSCEQVGEAEDGHGIYQYRVSDNGIGMSEEFQKHIFEQFSREETSTVSGIQGSGLGMSVVKTFVELMGGSVNVRSIQGQGTTVTVVLPFRLQEGRDASAMLPADGTAEQVDLTGRKALLVEDNELNREIAVEILKDVGLVVDTAENGSAAVAALKEKGPGFYDFVLMDIQMPVMNGYEATKAIRDMYPGAKLPIIALSANAFAEDKAASIAAGMDAHVAKPIDIGELFTTLARFL